MTYFGTYIPNHGVLTIVAAAGLLKEHPEIHFEMIGTGPELPAAQQLAAEEKLENITFIEWLEPEALAERAASTNLHLGVFGKTPQSMMTIQNKIFQGMAMQLPVLSGDSPAMRDEFTHGKHCYLVERANPTALAEAIQVLKNNPALCQTIAAGGYELFLQQFTIERLGERFERHLAELIQKA